MQRRPELVVKFAWLHILPQMWIAVSPLGVLVALALSTHFVEDLIDTRDHKHVEI